MVSPKLKPRGSYHSRVKMTTQYLYYQSITQFRIPIKGGVVGAPEHIKAFTTPIKGTQKSKQTVKKVKREDVASESTGNKRLL